MGINVTATAPGQTSGHGGLYLAQNPENYTYDADGNLTQDGRWTYAWDGENRLISMTSLTNAPTASIYKLSFTYDYHGEEDSEDCFDEQRDLDVAQYTNRFVYDGWNLVAILNPASITFWLRLYGARI